MFNCSSLAIHNKTLAEIILPDGDSIPSTLSEVVDGDH